MYEQSVSTSETPRVEVTACQGELTVVTWDKAEVSITVDSEEVLTVEERDDAVAVAANGDCRLTVPVMGSLVVVQVQGDLSVQGVSGAVEVVAAQGDVQLRDSAGSMSLNTVQGDLTVGDWAGPLDVNTVQGDAEVRQAAGTVNLDTVGSDLTAEDVFAALAAASVLGDAYVRRLNAPLSLKDVGGDLVARNLSAGADVAQVRGDVSLKTVFTGPYTYHIQAGGDIGVEILPGSHATFTLRADSGRVKVKGLTGGATEEGEWQGTVGNGEAQVTLVSEHGSIALKARGEGEQEYAAFAMATEFGDMQATAGLTGAELAQRIQQRVAEKLSKIDFEAIAVREAERARRQAERELSRAQRVADRARRKAERAREKAERKRAQWRVEWDAARGPRRASSRSQGASEEERLAILKMLAEGKISAQEAETLLQALEG
jgi:DUF4097 and DUF4098 domain-containing protein YvlB